jgi:hypothetical protein
LFMGSLLFEKGARMSPQVGDPALRARTASQRSQGSQASKSWAGAQYGCAISSVPAARITFGPATAPPGLTSSVGLVQVTLPVVREMM